MLADAGTSRAHGLRSTTFRDPAACTLADADSLAPPVSASPFHRRRHDDSLFLSSLQEKRARMGEDEPRGSNNSGGLWKEYIMVTVEPNTLEAVTIEHIAAHTQASKFPSH